MAVQSLSPPPVADGAVLPDILLALAHEMRGILSPLKVTTDLLADPTTLEPPDLARLTGIVYEGVRWLEGLSEALIACALIRSQGLTLQVQEFSPQDWVQPVIQLITPLLGRRGQQVRFHCPDPGLRIVGDPRWLGHALLNLLTNAIRHGPAGDVIEVAVTSEGDRVRVSVTDHGAGPGTEPDPPEVSDWPPRMGVGLQVVGLIAGLHGGTVGAAGGAGQSTVFWVDLPVTVKVPAGGRAR